MFIIHCCQLANRCVTESECRSTSVLPAVSVSEVSRSASKINAYKIYKNKCVFTCPSDHMEVNTTTFYCNRLFHRLHSFLID